MQWHQQDHMQTICTSLQTDNHTNTPSLYRPDAFPNTKTNSAKSLNTKTNQTVIVIKTRVKIMEQWQHCKETRQISAQ